MSMLLNEEEYKKFRGELKNRSKQGDEYAQDNQQFGKNRWIRRLKQATSNSTKEYNQIDMNKFFKEDLLDFNVPVKGETDNYLARLSIGGVLRNIQDSMADTGVYELNHKVVRMAIIKSFNEEELKYSCTCPDWKYTHAYYASKGNYNAGENVEEPSIHTNPDDTKGGMCKHIARVMSNQSWIMKMTSVIVNYVRYMEVHYEELYQKVIFPKLYGKEYDEVYLPTDKETIDASNKWAKEKTQFKPGNEYRFRKASEYEEPAESEPEEVEKSFDVDSIGNEDNEISD